MCVLTYASEASLDLDILHCLGSANAEERVMSGKDELSLQPPLV